MYRLLADLVLNRAAAIAIVVGTLLLGAVCLVLSAGLEQDDDVLAFLPEGNADIETFHAVNERFGGLDVALVGIAVDDPFDPAFLTKLQDVSTRIRESGGVERVLSLTTVDDFTEDPVMGGIVTSALVADIPSDEAGKAALREKVMSRDHVVGVMISEQADAVLLYVFASPGTPSRQLAGTVRGLVFDAFPDHELYWGGAPFISNWIYDTTQADMARLTPWAVVLIVAMILLSFRDLTGSVLALLTTGIGIVVSRAAMAVTGTPFNIVLSSMPVILFALGSAYSIHMLSRYYANRGLNGDAREALRRTVEETSPVVVAAGLTTVAGMGSFVVMDIAPMRTFGAFTALGILTTLVLALTFVPAVIGLAELRGWEEGTDRVSIVMAKVVRAVSERGAAWAVVLLVVAVLGGFFVGRVDNRMDQSTFFSEGSLPDRGQTFLDEHFGGSQFLQIQVQGDLSRPEVLREVRQLADELRVLPHVTEVQHVGDVVELVNAAMDGVQRVPDKANQVGVLYGFLAGQGRQLVTDEKDTALLHVKIGSNQADALDAVLASARERVAARPTSWVSVDATSPEAADRVRDQVIARIRGLAASYDVPLSADDATIEAALLAPPTDLPADAIRADLVAFLGSEECFAGLNVDQAAAAAAATLALGADPDPDAWAAALTPALVAATPDLTPEAAATLAEDVVVSTEPVLADLRARAGAARHAATVLAAAGASVPDSAKGRRFEARVAATLLDLRAPTALMPGSGDEAKPLVWTVTGLPVMYAGLSESVTRNQFTSLLSALALVLIILTVLFRSLSAGLLGTLPTAVTLLVVYGAMGAMDVHLDIGTSMIGSIIIGAGVDYAVHLMAAWRGATVAEARDQAVLHTAPAIWTNAFMVAAGFFVLTLGDAKPLQNVGGLTSAAMLVAAIATFVAVPALARATRYGGEP